jgi:hypothetical protein
MADEKLQTLWRNYGLTPNLANFSSYWRQLARTGQRELGTSSRYLDALYEALYSYLAPYQDKDIEEPYPERGSKTKTFVAKVAGYTIILDPHRGIGFGDGDGPITRLNIVIYKGNVEGNAIRIRADFTNNGSTVSHRIWARDPDSNEGVFHQLQMTFDSPPFSRAEELISFLLDEIAPRLETRDIAQPGALDDVSYPSQPIFPPPLTWRPNPDDFSIRQMEHKWQSSGAHQDLVRLLRARLLTGLDPARLNIAAGLLHPAAQEALNLPVTTRPEGYLRLAPDGGLSARDIPQCLELMWDYDADRDGGRYFSPGMAWRIDVRLEALKIMSRAIQQIHEGALRRSRMMYGVGPDAGQFTRDRIIELQNMVDKAIEKTQASIHVDNWRDMISEAGQIINDLQGGLVQVNRSPYNISDANVELREKLLNPVFNWAFGGTEVRRNPDQSLREIEREYSLSGDRRDWLRLQMALMRTGQPYERTFVERTDNREDTYEISHGEKWLETFFNNGWRIETWWDDNYFDTGISIIGWTTLVYNDSEEQVGAAVHCGSDDDCAENCHSYRVMDIISGYIEDGGDETYPLEDAAPVYLTARDADHRYRRNADRDLRDLERQATTDPTAREGLTRAQKRAGIPTTYAICSDCDDYVTEKYLCSTVLEGERCNNFICIDCSSTVTEYGSDGWPESVFCPEHRIVCEECDLILGGKGHPSSKGWGVYRCGSCKNSFCGNCLPTQQCGVCDDYVCEMCDFYTCESFEHEGEYYPRCGINLCESCNQVHDCTN